MVAYHELLLHTTYTFFTYELSIQLNPLLLNPFCLFLRSLHVYIVKQFSSHLNIHCIIALLMDDQIVDVQPMRDLK